MSSVRRPADPVNDGPSACKRKTYGATSVSEVIGSPLNPSPSQLRQLWEYDNKCANKYMGVPIRTCTSREPADQPGDNAMSKEFISLVFSDIRNMWQRLSSIFEIFHEKENPALGYRVRLKKDLPIKILMKERDQIAVGWRAVYALGCPSEHLYERSDIQHNHQYLGGPVSYCNWAPNKSANLYVRQVSHGSAQHLVRSETKSALPGGTELLWDYGKKQPPSFNNEGWFNPECCSVLQQVSKPLSLKKEKIEVYEDLCVLCGAPYRAKSDTGRKAQKKVHFLNSHADFLGTDWNGSGKFDCVQNPVNYDVALLEAERLNRLLVRLHSDGWKVVPACTVMSKRELAGDSENVMTLFRNHCARLKKLGSIVLRGRTVPTDVEHLVPVRPSRWDKIFPAVDQKPNRVYAMNKADRVANEAQLEDWTAQDVMMIMNSNLNDSDSSSEDDEDA